MMRARRRSIAAMLLLAGALHACGGTQFAPAPQAAFRPAIHAASGRALVRIFQGAPNLQASTGGVPVGIGAGFLSVNGTTVDSNFPYGSIAQYKSYPAGTLSLTVGNSLGYRVGPLTSPSLTGGKSYTLAIVGSYPKYRVLAFEDPALGAGATLAVYNASPGSSSTDYGAYNAKKGGSFRKLGSVKYGATALSSLGKSVRNLGAYIGSGTTPASKLTVASVDGFDADSALPFHNATRLSLIVVDRSSSESGPLFGVLDGDNTAPAIVHPFGSPSPAPGQLLVDHNGYLSFYHLPLKANAKPTKTLQEAPGEAVAPKIAVDPHGKIAIATNTEIRFFKPPIRSFAPSAAALKVALVPSITEIGPSGADLSDIEYDPNSNLWLVNNLGGEVSELRKPISPHSVAALFIVFGAPDSKTAGYSTLVQARFDVNATLYVYASNGNAGTSSLFKVGFPYAKQPSSMNVDLSQADFVDPSQYATTNPSPVGVILGQYFGSLASPPPQAPPPPPAAVTGQFYLPLNPVRGLFPNVSVDQVSGAVLADPMRTVFYTLDAANGALRVFPLPLQPKSRSVLEIACKNGSANCNSKTEHLFFSP